LAFSPSAAKSVVIGIAPAAKALESEMQSISAYSDGYAKMFAFW
jgi:hypothetical protein